LQRNIFLQLNEEYQEVIRATSVPTATGFSSSSSESERQFKLLLDNLHKLQNSLYSISDLFNTITEPYKLWEYSLIIIYLCKYDDLNMIHKLWKSIIFR
jgi:hypothetical protein